MLSVVNNNRSLSTERDMHFISFTIKVIATSAYNSQKSFLQICLLAASLQRRIF